MEGLIFGILRYSTGFSKKNQKIKKKIEVAGNIKDRKEQNAGVDGWGLIKCILVPLERPRNKV